ncbi:hypothetical protein HOLleu_20491 [Holothuria leucospilota]|uniref:Uncharacterized protein n=1 Tax=Holothuria leucospilota TaxID=206669 RepID=A0A9Q1H8H4_HOLLE|nr:hypothetical protein HOLleu_20491 [Holothuria leucospilota]
MQFESRGMDSAHLQPSLHQHHGQTFHDGAQSRSFTQAIAGPFYETMTGGNHPPSSFAFSHPNSGNYMGFMGGFPYHSSAVSPPVHSYGSTVGHTVPGGSAPQNETGSSPWTPGNQHNAAEATGNYYPEAPMGASTAVDLTRQTPEYQEATPNEAEHTPKSQSSTENSGAQIKPRTACLNSKRRLTTVRAAVVRTVGCHHLKIRCELVKSVNRTPNIKPSNWKKNFCIICTSRETDALIYLER